MANQIIVALNIEAVAEALLFASRAGADPAPNTFTTQQLFSACASPGGGSLDHSALVTALEQLANHRVAGSA